MNRSQTTTSYDAFPYPSFPFAETNPQRLASLAHLLGLDPAPAPLERCRVLELGAGSGGNLIPMAEQLPEAEFVGIDLSQVQVDEGREAIQQTGLTNVQLHCGDIREVSESWGKFDYVIAHGVYSWVPAEVRQAMLDIYRRHLQPWGVGLISYNTYPGWHLRGMMRDMMLYHTMPLDDLALKAEQARGLIGFLERVVDPGLPLHKIVENERKCLERVKGGNSYVVHEFLEEVNQPFYVAEFAAQLDYHGLQYLGDADPGEMSTERLPPEAAETLARLESDPSRREQYFDFITMRQFRHTLIGHREAQIQGRLVASRLEGLYLGARLQCAKPEADPSASEVLEFSHPKGTTIRIAHPLTKAALLHLLQSWPETIRGDELVVEARKRLSKGGGAVYPAASYAEETERMMDHLLRGVCNGLVEVYAAKPRYVCQPSDRPTASRFARFQLASGKLRIPNETGPVVTNLRHEGIELAQLPRLVLPLLDGTRDHFQLASDLAEVCEREQFVVERSGRPIESAEDRREVLEAMLPQQLKSLAAAALLVG